MAVNGRRSVRR